MEGEKDEPRPEKRTLDEPSPGKDIDETTIIDLDIVGFEEETPNEKGPLIGGLGSLRDGVKSRAGEVTRLQGLKEGLSSRTSGLMNLQSEITGKAGGLLKRKPPGTEREGALVLEDANNERAPTRVDNPQGEDEGLGKLKTELEAKEAQIKELLGLKNELEAKLKEVEGLKDRIKEKDNEMLKLKGAEMRQNIKVKTLEQNLGEKERSLTEAQEMLKAEKEKSTILEAKISQLGGRVGSVSQGLMEVKNSHRRHTKRFSLVEKEVQMVTGDLQKLIPNLKERLETFAATLDQKEAELQDLFHENETLMASNIMLKQRLDTLRKQTPHLEKEVREARSARSGLEFTAQRQEVTIKNLERELEDKLKIIQDLQSEDRTQDFHIHELRRSLQKIRLLDKIFADNLRLQKE